jgi:SPP1 family predicted phage head-tail adaptor
MSIGTLDHRLTVEQMVQTPDGAGGYVLSWQTYLSVWGQIEPSGGRERLAAFALQSSVTHRVIIRRQTGVTNAMRVKAGGRLFKIRAVEDLGPRGRFLELLCEEGVAT